MPGWCSIQRAVTSNVAGALTSRAAGQIAMVGLFVDADDAVIADAALVATKLNALQLHGSERVAERARARLESRCGRALPSPAPADVTRHGHMPGGGGLDLVRRQDPQRRAAPAWGWRSTGRCWPDIAVPCRGGWQAG